MITQQLLDYIKQQLQQGINKEQIKNLLITEGWQAQDIDEAFAFIEGSIDQLQSVSPSVQTISSLPGAIAILGQAWAIYKQRIATFLGIVIIPMLVYGLSFGILLVVSVMFLGATLLFFKNVVSLPAAGGIGPNIGLSIILFLVIIAGSIIGVWSQTALLYAIKSHQEKIGVIESYKRGWRKIISYWWVFLLMSFITLGGFSLLIVPGIIFAIWFSLAPFILITEDLKGMNALLKSREYVRGRWGSITWRFLFIAALYLVITFSSFPFLWLFGPIIFIIELFLYPLVIIYGFLVYSNLKAVKGEIVFTPTKGQKIFFILIPIFGILFLCIVTAVVVPLLGRLRTLKHPRMHSSPLKLELKTEEVELKTEEGRDRRRQTDLRQIQIALEMYYTDHGRYPHSLDELSPNYYGNVPVDPLTNQPYQYQLQPNGEDYKICIHLQSTKAQECFTSQFDARRQTDLKQIQVGLELYYNDHDRYPYLLDELMPEYFRNVPVDPLTNQPYQYQLQPNGEDYKICIHLQSTKAQKCLTSRSFLSEEDVLLR